MTTKGHTLMLEKVTHRFGANAAVRDVSLEIAAGELVALLGPSGCGKSTLLRVIAGFLEQSEGRVLFDGESVDHLPANRRGVGIVFQNYALFPHMSVWENVAYGLEARRTAKHVVADRVRAMLDLVHMSDFRDRMPRQLSGGQQQRVAVARALAVEPRILLLDEPFGALDKNLRLDMQIEVKRLQRDYGITTIIVTHDQEEALSMADRVAVMNAGAIEQFATPTEIYDRPTTLFVNQFVGHTNLLRGTLARGADGSTQVNLGDCGAMPCGDVGSIADGAAVMLSLRPERLRLSRSPLPGAIEAAVKVTLPLGGQIVYDCETRAGTQLKVNLPRDLGAEPIDPGHTVYLTPVSPAACQIFPVA